MRHNYKYYIEKFWDAIHKMKMDGMIDTPNKFAAINDIEIGLHELHKAFEQEIKNRNDKKGAKNERRAKKRR